jgi:hypothetical protein
MQANHFHRKKCQDTLQLIAAIVDSSTPNFLPKNENASVQNNSCQNNNNNNDATKHSSSLKQHKFENQKNEFISQDHYWNQSDSGNKMQNCSSNKNVITSAKLIEGYQQKVLDPFRLVNAVKDQQKRRVL